MLFAKRKALFPSLLETFREKKSFPKSLFPGFSGKVTDPRWFEYANHRGSNSNSFAPLFF